MSQVVRRVWRAVFPMRMGGLDQMALRGAVGFWVGVVGWVRWKWVLVRLLVWALCRARVMARLLVSMPWMVAWGARFAMVRAMGP